MEESTSFKSKGEGSNESSKLGVTIRGWITFLLVFTVCVSHLGVSMATLINAVRNKDFQMVGSLTTIGEPLYSMSVAALGYYFGSQKMKGEMPSNTTTTTSTTKI